MGNQSFFELLVKSVVGFIIAIVLFKLLFLVIGLAIGFAALTMAAVFIVGPIALIAYLVYRYVWK